jgi:hypothetical protein
MHNKNWTPTAAKSPAPPPTPDYPAIIARLTEALEDARRFIVRFDVADDEELSQSAAISDLLDRELPILLNPKGGMKN